MAAEPPPTPPDSEASRLAAELLNGGKAEAVGLKTLRGYQPTYMERDGVTVELPQPDRREAPGIRVRRTDGEIALYLTPTMERARSLLAEARRIVAAQEVDRAVEAQRMEHVEHADAIRDAAVYGVGWIKYVWDHRAGRARPVRVHPERIQERS